MGRGVTRIDHDHIQRIDQTALAAVAAGYVLVYGGNGKGGVKCDERIQEFVFETCGMCCVHINK